MSTYQYLGRIMGTTLSFDLRSHDSSEAGPPLWRDVPTRSARCITRGRSAPELGLLVDLALARLTEIDAIFSTYKPDSEISRLGRGEISLDDCCQDVHEVLRLCDVVSDASHGSFDIYAAAQTLPAIEVQSTTNSNARPIEPSGMVKGWAIDQAASVLWAAGVEDFYVNIGGDVVASGSASPGSPWRIGIKHPLRHESHLMSVIAARNVAIATSAFYERGPHIVDPHGTKLSELLSLTVVGPDIVLVDAYATAAFTMGLAGLDWVASMPGFEVLAADASGETHYSAGLSELLLAV